MRKSGARPERGGDRLRGDDFAKAAEIERRRIDADGVAGQAGRRAVTRRSAQAIDRPDFVLFGRHYAVGSK